MMYLASLVEETKDKVKGYKFIHTKSELDVVVCDNLASHRVLIRQDFAREFFTPNGLVQYVENVRKINLNIVIELDITDEIVTQDSMIEKIKNCYNLEELIQLSVMYRTEFMSTLYDLIEHRESDYTAMLEFSNQVSRLQQIIEEMQTENQQLSYSLDTERNNKLAAQSKLHALISRINYQYNKGIDQNKLFKVDKNSYDKVLYIKEISRVQYVDTLVYYLKEILKTLYSMPTRIVVVESYYAMDKIRLYPDLKPHHELIERDVLKGDILMLGMQSNIMEDVLRNASHISILIVLDRGGYAVPHISGDNVEMIYTVSDLKDKPDYIPNGRVISYDESTLFIKYIKDFEQMDTSARIAAYSSMTITKQLVELLERK